VIIKSVKTKDSDYIGMTIERDDCIYIYSKSLSTGESWDDVSDDKSVLEI